MAPALKPPRFHDLPSGATVIDKENLHYLVVGSRYVPHSNLHGAWPKLMVSFKRKKDGEVREVGEVAYTETVVGYIPPQNARTRARSA